MSDPSTSTGDGDTGWTPEEGTAFFRAYAKHGPKWEAVAAEVGTKDADACEALFLAHTSYLSLPQQYQHEVAFVAMVSDHAKIHSAQPAESDDTVSEDATRGGGGASPPRFAKARRTPRAASAGRGGGAPSGTPARSPAAMLSPGAGRRRAPPAPAPPAPELAVPAAWGGRGKRGAAVPAASPETSALKRKRAQARPRVPWGQRGSPCGGALQRLLCGAREPDARISSTLHDVK